MDMYVVSEVVMKVLSLVVISCVLNQNCEHWFFEDAFKFNIFDICELHDELANWIIFNNLGDLEVNVCDTKLEDLIIHM